jgi:hypothetical protein
MASPALDELLSRLEEKTAQQNLKIRNCLTPAKMMAETVKYYELININH